VNQLPPELQVTVGQEDAMARLDELRAYMQIPDTRPLNIVGVGAGAWGSVFIGMLQKNYGLYDPMRQRVSVSIWRREGKIVGQKVAAQLLEVINNFPDVIRRLRENGSYIKYVEARVGDRELYADEVLRDGFCANMVSVPLCPLKVVTDLEEAVYNADIVINSIPSTETRAVFERIGKIWSQRNPDPSTWPLVVSLSKGVECTTEPTPHIMTPTGIIHEVSKLPINRLLYLGGPNIAQEVWEGKYATSRICGAEYNRRALAKFFRSPNFVVWDHPDVVTHEVMGGLKNVYAIGAGIISAATNHCATSMAVYFSNACAEMVFITHLLSQEPDYLAGPLLADTYVTLLKGRNAWYGEQLGSAELFPEDGAHVPGKGLIQGVSATEGFFELLSHEDVQVRHPQTGENVTPINLLPTLNALHDILSNDGTLDLTTRSPALRKRRSGREPSPAPRMVMDASLKRERALKSVEAFVNAMKDASASDPAQSLALSRLSEGQYFNASLTLPCFQDA